MNARAGSENISYKRAMGMEGCGSVNDNWERLLNCCMTFDLIIGGKLLAHPDIHKIYLVFPKRQRQEPDRPPMINGTWRRALQDVKVRRGADVGSDHHLVTATLKVKLSKSRPKKLKQQQFDMERLRDPKAKSAFILQLKNKFQALADEENHLQIEPADIETVWKQVKSACTQTSEACLGRRRQKKKKEWISASTWRAIENRRALKKKVLETKSETERKIKPTIQESPPGSEENDLDRHKSDYVENLAREAEKLPLEENKHNCTRSQNFSAASTRDLQTYLSQINRANYLQQKQNKRCDGQNILAKCSTDHYQQ